jgi:hypothetical protein
LTKTFARIIILGHKIENLAGRTPFLLAAAAFVLSKALIRLCFCLSG